MKTAKFWIALLTAALNGVVGILPVGSTASQWTMFVLTVLGAIGVYLVPNSPTGQRSTGEAYSRS